MKKSKKIDFSIGIFDIISDSIKDKIKREASNCELYGLGVYTDEIVIEEYGTYPTKKFEDRMKSAKQIEGVDFVFKVNSTDIKELKRMIEQVYIKVLKNK